jgi:PEP-CTERM motif
MNLKSAFVSLVLAFAGAVAQASPVIIGESASNLGNAAASVTNFTDVYQLTVAHDTDYLLNIITQSKQQNDVVLYSVLLSNGTDSYLFDATDDGTSFLSALWSTSTSTTASGKQVTYQNQTYELSKIFLTAGDWTLTVTGADTNNKAAGSYLVTANAVPEPASLALVLAGIAAAGLVARRHNKPGLAR